MYSSEEKRDQVLRCNVSSAEKTNRLLIVHLSLTQALNPSPRQLLFHRGLDAPNDKFPKDWSSLEKTTASHNYRHAC